MASVPGTPREVRPTHRVRVICSQHGRAAQRRRAVHSAARGAPVCSDRCRADGCGLACACEGGGARGAADRRRQGRQEKKKRPRRHAHCSKLACCVRAACACAAASLRSILPQSEHLSDCAVGTKSSEAPASGSVAMLALPPVLPALASAGVGAAGWAEPPIVLPTGAWAESSKASRSRHSAG